MRIKNLLAGFVVFASLCSVSVQAAPIIIDDFNTDQGRMSAAPGWMSVSTVRGAGILGGERDLILRNLSPDILSGESTLSVSNGELNFSAGSRVISQFEIQWDGKDGSNRIDRDGLGGVDFSQFDVISFITSIVFSDADAFFDISFWSNKGNSRYRRDTITLEIPEVESERDAYFLSSAAGLSGVNFGDIGAIRVIGNVTSPVTRERVKSYDLTISEVKVHSVSAPLIASMFMFSIFGLFLLTRRRKQ